MFFRTHEEGQIGYKELTKPDLGDAPGNTTHIGLFGDILRFLPNRDYVDSSMFIYNNECSSLDFSFDRIQNQDGTYRSPKIRKGGKDVASVTTVIRDLYNQHDPSYRWFLIWFGLESEEVVFYLFHNHSADYACFEQYIDLSKDRCRGKIQRGDENFENIIHYLEDIVNRSNQSLIDELEVVSQVGQRLKKYRQFDINRANEIFKTTGLKGETLVAEYLEKLKFQHQITNYSWFNKSMESGLPYDFTIQQLNQNVVYVDVKSTSSSFEQPMIFSSQEIEFITQASCYSIFRVYNLSSEHDFYMRTCDNSKQLASIVNPMISNLGSELLQNKIILQTAKLAIPTLHECLQFGSEVTLEG